MQAVPVEQEFEAQQIAGDGGIGITPFDGSRHGKTDPLKEVLDNVLLEKPTAVEMAERRFVREPAPEVRDQPERASVAARAVVLEAQIEPRTLHLLRIVAAGGLQELADIANRPDTTRAASGAARRAEKRDHAGIAADALKAFAADDDAIERRHLRVELRAQITQAAPKRPEALAGVGNVVMGDAAAASGRGVADALGGQRAPIGEQVPLHAGGAGLGKTDMQRDVLHSNVVPRRCRGF